MADRRNIAMRPSLATPGRSRAAFVPPQNFSEIRSSGAVAGIQRELEKARQSGDEAKEQSLLDMLGDSDPVAQAKKDSEIPEGLTAAQAKLVDDLVGEAGMPEGFQDRARERAQPKAQPKSEPKPKAQLERFESVGDMDFDKVARPPGDPFVYAMKGGKIFVMNPKKPNEGFRDVTGIQNEAAIRGVIEKFGEAPEREAISADKARAAFAGRDVTQSTPAIKEGMLEEERILGTRRSPGGVSYEGT
jgi:hypothetical protein